MTSKIISEVTTGGSKLLVDFFEREMPEIRLIGSTETLAPTFEEIPEIKLIGKARHAVTPTSIAPPATISAESLPVEEIPIVQKAYFKSKTDRPNIYVPASKPLIKQFQEQIKDLRANISKIPINVRGRYNEFIRDMEIFEFNLAKEISATVGYLKQELQTLYADFIAYINRFINWLTSPVEKTNKMIILEVNELLETKTEFIKYVDEMLKE